MLKMHVYVFGNGNLPLNEFLGLYVTRVETLLNLCNRNSVRFILCDYRGVDTLMMEYLKTQTPHVTIFHIGDKPRYFPATFRTLADVWTTRGGFRDDAERDECAINCCTHFLAHDVNSNEVRKSGTQRNIERCLELGKTKL